MPKDRNDFFMRRTRNMSYENVRYVAQRRGVRVKRMGLVT